MGLGLDHQEAAGRVVGQFWNRSKPFFRSKPEPLAAHPDPLPTLPLPQIWVEGCPPLPKRQTPTPAVRQHQLDSGTVTTRDGIKIADIVKQVQCPLILIAANFVYPHQATDVFNYESLHTISIQQTASIYNRCQHFCPSSCLPLS